MNIRCITTTTTTEVVRTTAVALPNVQVHRLNLGSGRVDRRVGRGPRGGVGRSKICTRRVSGIDLLGAVIGCGCTRTSLRAPTPELGRTGEERPRAVGEDPAVAAAETIGQPGLRQGLQRLLDGMGIQLPVFSFQLPVLIVSTNA
jgi:hypothetical protein